MAAVIGVPLLLSSCGEQKIPRPFELPPDALLDRAAEWWGGRTALAAERAFRQEGELFLPNPGGDPLTMKVEVLTRHDPFAMRERKFIEKVDALSGEVLARNEMYTIVDGDKGWRTDLTTGKVSEDPSLGATMKGQPSPRKVLLHREYHMTLEDRGREKVPELADLECARILCTDPTGLAAWVYIDEEARLRKIAFQMKNNTWIRVVFETYRDPKNLDGNAIVERVSNYVGPDLAVTYLWGKREIDPSIDESSFRPPVK